MGTFMPWHRTTSRKCPPPPSIEVYITLYIVIQTQLRTAVHVIPKNCESKRNETFVSAIVSYGKAVVNLRTGLWGISHGGKSPPSS